MLKNIFKRKEDNRTESEKMVDRIFNHLMWLVFLVMMVYLITQPVEFEGELTVSSDVLEYSLKSYAPDQFNNMTINSTGQNTIRMKGRMPLFLVVSGLLE